ncbi:non-specific lipid-transfer protein-like protein [Tripterygium wilfordii]|uniref:Non-specific lipid-transfer protein-like protein n=1 Tax=Tripterygium wilfordii TaxID=458696 RepID=A0A7J7CXC8_TRIWF|nr:non-specific lipid transfer protein GPI-anchored 19-like [Tripterygium wilfordii]KAF5738648.1 non-specific lipid-transfer protein-like protein [Tripterygium wilfordii]
MAAQARMALILVVVTMMWAGAVAQSSSCTNVLISMSPCLNYITGNSSTPSSQCCAQLSNVVSSSPQCLCEVLKGGGSSLGINVNQTQALALPAACNVQTPPISQCDAVSPAGTQSTPGTPSDTGSKTVPATQDGSSAGSSINLSISLLFFLLLASYGSVFTDY